YVVAGVTDHIVPWTAAYGATHMLGGPSQFVLSSSGHIQSLINPPGNPKASYHTDGPETADPRRWLAEATQFKGSWWEHWAQWIGGRSGDRGRPARPLGSDRDPQWIRPPRATCTRPSPPPPPIHYPPPPS